MIDVKVTRVESLPDWHVETAVMGNRRIMLRRWRETVEWFAANNVTTLYEVGSGKVLTGLARRIDKSVTGIAMDRVDPGTAIDRIIARYLLPEQHLVHHGVLRGDPGNKVRMRDTCRERTPL